MRSVDQLRSSETHSTETEWYEEGKRKGRTSW